MNIVVFNTKKYTILMFNTNTYKSHGIIWTINA